MSANDLNSRDTLSLFRELPYFGLNVNLAHGQFNNCLPSHLPAKKYLEKLSSIYHLNLFKLNALEDTNPGDSLYNHRIHSRYYSPYSFYKFKSELPSRVSDSSFSLLHNNIRRTSYFLFKVFHLFQLLTNQHVFTITQPP